MKNLEYLSSERPEAGGGNGKSCPVCGSRIIGRRDKIFCCDECRTYYHNAKRYETFKIRAYNHDINKIYASVSDLFNQKAYSGLKIVAFISVVCKFIFTFERADKKEDEKHDKNDDGGENNRQ